LELPSVLPHIHPNPGCYAMVEDDDLSRAEQDALEAELSQGLATLPRPADVELLFVRSSQRNLELVGLSGLTDSELDPLLEELESRVADRKLMVWNFGCGRGL
jgi:hypothetical protein